MEAVHERLHEQDAGVAGRRDHPLGIGRGQGQWLLAQDVLARLDRGERPLQVEVVREGDVDRVDVRVGEEALVRIVRARDCQLARDPLRDLAVARGDRHHLAPLPRRAADARDPLLARDVRGGQHAPAQLPVVHRGGLAAVLSPTTAR